MISFLPIKISGTEPSWCVDGRPDYNFSKGPQMLGGSLHPVLLWVMTNDKNLEDETLKQGLALLKDHGFGVGVHRGEHAHPHDNGSDCGFADKMPLILQTALDKKEEISKRLSEIYEANKAVIGEMPLANIVSDVYEKLGKFEINKISTTGEKLISIAEGTGTQVITMQGDHQEETAFVNLKEGLTLDTNGLNKFGQQAFNLDLWMVLKQAQALGIDSNFALGASLILYLATEIVLVEMKGKPALPVVIV